MNHFLMLLATVFLVVYSNVMVKARINTFDAAETRPGAAGFFVAIISDPLMWSAVAATGLGMVLYLLALRRVDVSVAQPMLAIVFVAVPLSAAIFLGEHLSGLRLAGLGCITLGILLIIKSA